jgi:thiosulfate/3-mercaptopyruvate sulfurtransferase
MKLKATIFASLLIFLVCSSSVLAAPEATASSIMPPVVTTTWLAEHHDDPGLIILHIGPPDSYQEKHIPGARSASLRKMIRVNEAGIRDEMIPVEEISKALSELGIGNESRIVIYFADENGAWAVARYLLTLEYVGMSGRVAHLDGGLPKWVTEKHPVSSEVPSVETSNLVVKIAPNVLVDTKWLSARIEKPGISVLDGRPAEGYSGLAGEWDRLGHIPGAVNIPFFTLLAEDPPYLLKSKEELAKMFREVGVKAGDTVIAYCGTGLWASFPYLAARYLGYETRLYDGSYQEWSATENLPIVAPATRGDSDN